MHVHCTFLQVCRHVHCRTFNAPLTPSACVNGFVKLAHVHVHVHVCIHYFIAVPTFLSSQIQHSPETILLV